MESQPELPGLKTAELERLKEDLERTTLAHQIAAAERAEKRRKAREEEAWYGPFWRAFRTGAFFIAHALSAALLISVFSLVTRLLEIVGSPRLFGRFPVAYIFDGMDQIIMVVFGIFGVAEAITVFRD